MTAIDGLIEEAGELDRYCRKSFEPAIREMEGIDATIQALISIALELQKQLSNLIIFRIKPPLPIEEGKEETGAGKDEATAIQQFIISIGAVNLYSLAEAIRDTFEPFEAQTSGIAWIFSPYAFLEKPSIIEPETIEKLAGKKSVLEETLQKNVNIEKEKFSTSKVISETENLYSDLYTDLKKSALVINDLKNICDNFENITIERDSIISEKDIILNKPSDLIEGYKEEAEETGRNEILDVKTFSDNLHYFSRIIEDASNSLYTGISELHEITDTSSLNKNLTEHFESTALIKDLTDVYSSQETFKSSNIISDLSETVAMISKALQTGFLESQTTTDISSHGFVSLKTLQSSSNFSEISSLNKISTRVSHPAEIKTDDQKPIKYSDQSIFEVPAFRPRMSSEDAAINFSKLSNAISKKSHEKESISISEPSINVSNAFETISSYIAKASEVDRQTSEMARGGVIDTDKISWQSPLLNLMLSEGGSAALELDRLAINGNSGLTEAVQMANIAIGTHALEKAGSSAMNNIDLMLSQDYRMPSPGTVQNALQILSVSQKDTAGGTHSGNTINFQNTFNIVVDIKNGGKETELRELGRKIGQILSDEIRRYGGIR
ncbi:MAG: hypothetical protein O8C55_04525 [Candidatus Methanoperedens sp.]|nr:hypothetical protein [Candidatus Methanoperedens sp.]